MKFLLFASVFFTGLAAPVPAGAETLVAVTDDGIQPQVVTEWSAQGREVELAVRGDVDPSEVASAVEAGIDRVKAKVRAGRVVVIGKPLEELLPLLAVIEIGDGGSLAELEQLAAVDTDFGSGSSLRAKKKAQVDAAFSDPTRSLVAQVLGVEHAEFPRTRLKLRVLKSPRGALQKVASRGRVIVVVPQIATKDGAIDWGSVVTQTNAGAFYFEPDDRVRVRLRVPDADGEGDFVAEAVAR